MCPFLYSGVPFVAVLTTRALLFRVHKRHLFWKLQRARFVKEPFLLTPSLLRRVCAGTPLSQAHLNRCPPLLATAGASIRANTIVPSSYCSCSSTYLKYTSR